jgi:hypothetical protein
VEKGAQLLSGFELHSNPKLEQYQAIVQKAYSGDRLNSNIYLEQAKETMDGTELKLLMLML